MVPVEPPAIAAALADYFAQDREAAFTQGVKEEKKHYEWGTFIEKIVNLYREVSA